MIGTLVLDGGPLHLVHQEGTGRLGTPPILSSLYQVQNALPWIITSPVGMRSIAMSGLYVCLSVCTSVCLSVFPIVCLENHTSKLREIFCTCYPGRGSYDDNGIRNVLPVRWSDIGQYGHSIGNIDVGAALRQAVAYTRSQTKIHEQLTMASASL